MILGIDSVITQGAYTLTYRNGGWAPYEISTALNETLAARETAWLGVSLMGAPVYDIWGKDAVKFMNYYCVNRDWSTLKPGASRHAIMCNEKGNMIADGVAYLTPEGHIRTYWLAPMISYFAENTDMEIEYESITNEYFIQIDGPKSLEIMEHACGCDLHDLKFAHNKIVTCAGTPMTIHRLGMSGCLAYEMHGDGKHVDQVYTKIVEAGEPYGIVRAGTKSYCMNHSQAYVNQNFHLHTARARTAVQVRQSCRYAGEISYQSV